MSHKLRDEQILEMLAEHKRGKTYGQLAIRFKRSRTRIWHILNDKPATLLSAKLLQTTTERL